MSSKDLDKVQTKYKALKQESVAQWKGQFEDEEMNNKAPTPSLDEPCACFPTMTYKQVRGGRGRGRGKGEGGRGKGEGERREGKGVFVLFCFVLFCFVVKVDEGFEKRNNKPPTPSLDEPCACFINRQGKRKERERKGKEKGKGKERGSKYFGGFCFVLFVVKVDEGFEKRKLLLIIFNNYYYSFIFIVLCFVFCFFFQRLIGFGSCLVVGAILYALAIYFLVREDIVKFAVVYTIGLFYINKQTKTNKNNHNHKHNHNPLTHSLPLSPTRKHCCSCLFSFPCWSPLTTQKNAQSS